MIAGAAEPLPDIDDPPFGAMFGRLAGARIVLFGGEQDDGRARVPHLPVVLTSGYNHVLAKEDTHGFGLLCKPYSAEALSVALRKAREHGRQ